MARSAALVVVANEAKRNGSNALLRPEIARAIQTLQGMLMREATTTNPRTLSIKSERSAPDHQDDDPRLGAETGARESGANSIYGSSDASVSTGAISIGKPICTALVFPLPRDIWG